MKLNIGSGKTRITGYVNIDNYFDADVQADMGSLPYEDGEVDELYSSHALEHVSFHETQAVLREWLRVLRPGGKLTICVPNMDWVAAAWLHGSDRSYARQIMFGNQEHEGEFHKNGWARQDLINEVVEAGFTLLDCVVRWIPEYSQESILLEATK